MKEQVRLPSEEREKEDLFGEEGNLFRFEEKIGTGAQGDIYVCEWLKQGRQYAAKIIYTSRWLPREHEGKRKELAREISIMEKLHHPRVVNMHTHFWMPASVIIVMDLAREGDLCTKLEAEVALKRSAFRGLGGGELGSKHITRQVLDGLGYMHHNGVIHRDLKLENCLIHSTHQASGCELLDVKIADFGLSKQIDQGELQTPGGGGGTVSYAAPERFEHLLKQRKEFDERIADFWSFGVLLYHLLCGRPPYEGPRGHEGIAEILRKMKCIGNCEEWRAVSEDGRQFVRGLLNPEPLERLCLDGGHNCLIQKWLLADVPQDAGARMHRVPRQGVVSQVSGRVGTHVDRIELQLQDQRLSYGGAGGEALPSWTLKPDENIIAVMQETSEEHLGTAVVLYTSEGQVIAVEGSSSKERARFVASRGCHIVGLQFERSRLTGILMEAVPPEGGSSVVQLRGRSASAVDSVTFVLRGGQERSYGGQGGQAQGPWHLEEREFILVVEQVRRDWFLGNALIFYTSAGNVIKLAGLEPCSTRHFMAPQPTEQICGLQFHGSRIQRVDLCPANGDRGASEMSSYAII